MKQTVNRPLRSGLARATRPAAKPKRFVVKPLDLGTTPEQWTKWKGKSLQEIFDEADGPFAR